MIMAPTNDSQQIFTTARDYSIAHVNYATLFWSSLIGCKILKTNQNDLKTDAAEIQTQISLQDLLQVDVQKKYLYCPYWLRSVTRFATISPLWHEFKSLVQMFEGLFSIWQNFDPTYCSKNVLLLGKFSLLQMAQNSKVIQPSVHSVSPSILFNFFSRLVRQILISFLLASPSFFAAKNTFFGKL